MATCILANWWLGGEEDIPGQECSLGQEMLVPKVFYLPLGPHQCWWKVTKQWRKKQRRENGERPFFLVMLLELRNRVNKDWFMVVVVWWDKGLTPLDFYSPPWSLDFKKEQLNVWHWMMFCQWSRSYLHWHLSFGFKCCNLLVSITLFYLIKKN